MTKQITPADIELRKSTDRGGFTIWIGGEQWGVAAPQWCGGRGLMHNLRYPGGGAIQDAQENGYRYAAKVRGFHMRDLDLNGVKPTPPQEDAVKGRMADLINRGLVESPADRKTRLDAIAAESRAASEKRERHETWTREGLISLAKIPGISDKEVFALKHAYREIFHSDMPASESACIVPANYRCCDKAVPARCVCTYSTECPDHGRRCNGTHD